MQLLLVDLEFLICTSTEAQNQPHFPEDDVLLLLDPCGSFEPSFFDFGQQHFFLFSATTVNDFVSSDLFLLDKTVRTNRISALLSTFHRNT